MEEHKTSEDDIYFVLESNEILLLKKFVDKYPTDTGTQLFNDILNKNNNNTGILYEMSQLLKLVGSTQNEVTDPAEKKELKSVLSQRSELVRKFIEIRKLYRSKRKAAQISRSADDLS
jgi:hypothetical protein